MKRVKLLLLLLLLLLCFVCLCIFVYLCTKHNKQTKIHKQTKPITNSNVKGVCYFDIDDTLTTATGDIDSIIEECLKNNFDVGIITASNRTIDHICKEETGMRMLKAYSSKRLQKFHGKARPVAGSRWETQGCAGQHVMVDGCRVDVNDKAWKNAENVLLAAPGAISP